MDCDWKWNMQTRLGSDGSDSDEEVVFTKRKKGKAPKEKEPVKKKYVSMLGESDDAKRVSCIGNHIYFRAGVSKDSVGALNQYIVKLNSDFKELQDSNPGVDMTPKPIMLHINSYGGSVFAGFWAVDIIKQSKIPIDTIVEGASASCGTIMSVVGRKRYIRPTASMLIHQLSSWFGGKMTEIDDDYQNLEQMMSTIKKIYREHTKMSDDQLDEFLKHDVWWMSEKCLSTGLVDEIWKGD